MYGNILIFNSISKDIVEAFLYTILLKTYGRDLKKGLVSVIALYYINCRGKLASYRPICGSLLYKAQEIMGQLTCLMPLLQCSYGAAKSVSHIISVNHLMQFLMRLNDAYDHVQNQILVMDPLPSVNKAYFMIYVPKNNVKFIFYRRYL